MRKHHQKYEPWLYLLPALLVLTAVGLIPIGFVFFYSLHDTFGGNVSIWAGGQWFKEVLTSVAFYQAALRSLTMQQCVQMQCLPGTSIYTNGLI